MDQDKMKKIASTIVFAVLVVAILFARSNRADDVINQATDQTNAVVTTQMESNQDMVADDASSAKDKDDQEQVTEDAVNQQSSYVTFTFRKERYLQEHYEKHGKSMGYTSPEDYEEAASMVVNNPDALHKIESEDGDDVYYIEKTNEFVVVSTDGYIRTYFQPDGGIAYFNRQ